MLSHGGCCIAVLVVCVLEMSRASPTLPSTSATDHGRRAADAALSGGPDGRGWGGAVADSCSIGITAEHPNELGFRVTVRSWSRGATIYWQFDNEVALEKHWGPVRAVQTNHAMVLPFVLKGDGVKPRNKPRSVRRTDQWGFVLKEPYKGHWSVTCHLLQSPPPPSPPLVFANRTTLDALHMAALNTPVSAVAQASAVPSLSGAVSQLARSIASSLLSPFAISSNTTRSSSRSVQKAKRRGKRRARSRAAKGNGKGKGRGSRRSRAKPKASEPRQRKKRNRLMLM